MLNKRILVADNGSDGLPQLDSHLSDLGYDVLKVSNGISAIDCARTAAPALAVLAMKMPGVTGLQICRTLKDDPITAGISIILLAGERVEADCILAFEFGADDYVLKSISPRELTLRISAILRRKAIPRSAAAVLTAGTVALDRRYHRVTVRNKPVDMTATEFKLLTTLMENAGRTVARNFLLQMAWPPVSSNIDIRAVDSHVRRLRKKLGSKGDCIQTVRGFGYRVDEA